MSGATGAGSAAAGASSAGAGASGARGSATDSQGVAVTDTRGQQPSYESYNGPLPGERAGGQQSGPYHPPQAYGAPTTGGTAGGKTGAVRRPRTGART
ncbi:DUF3566 domain-containing protein, partial [Streptomyces sp. SID2131]|nr:DUF3566 domain-containing protein [Streptomyces sp. SID2131]